jgi:DNA replication protein DnaC
MDYGTSFKTGLIVSKSSRGSRFSVAQQSNTLPIQATLDRLHGLHLGAMADAYLAQHQDPATAALGFDERLGLLVDAEHLFRDNRKLARRLKEAKLRIAHACLEDIEYAPRRELDRSLLRQLATGRWILEHHNVLITGATGVGKTYLACALGQQACRQGYRALSRRLPRLFQELALARADGSYPTLLACLARIDCLIVDDWGIGRVTDVQRQDLLEVMEDRDAARSTISTSQLPRDQWHDYLGDPTVADAVLDRLIHHAYTIALNGPSRRKEKTDKAEKTDAR